MKIILFIDCEKIKSDSEFESDFVHVSLIHWLWNINFESKFESKFEHKSMINRLFINCKIFKFDLIWFKFCARVNDSLISLWKNKNKICEMNRFENIEINWNSNV